MKTQTVLLLLLLALGGIVFFFVGKSCGRPVEDSTYDKKAYEHKLDSLQKLNVIRDKRIDSLSTVLQRLGERNEQFKNDSIKIVKRYEKIIGNIVVYNSNQLYGKVAEYIATADSNWRGYLDSPDILPNKTDAP